MRRMSMFPNTDPAYAAFTENAIKNEMENGKRLLQVDSCSLVCDSWVILWMRVCCCSVCCRRAELGQGARAPLDPRTNPSHSRASHEFWRKETHKVSLKLLKVIHYCSDHVALVKHYIHAHLADTVFRGERHTLHVHTVYIHVYWSFWIIWM